MEKQFCLYTFIILFALLTSECKTSKNEKSSSDFTQLNNTTWEVSSLNGKSIEKGIHKPFLTFNTEDKKVSGSAGCNRMSAIIDAYPNSTKISFSRVVTTKMICTNMMIETTFLNNLKEVTSFRRENKKLTLYDDSNTEILSLFLR